MPQPIETLITNGRIVTEQGLYPADIAISGTQIVAIATPGTLDQHAETVVDAQGHLVLPGAIDIHVHCRTPGYDERGNFFTETCAAATGGVTTIFEMLIGSILITPSRERSSQHIVADAVSSIMT